MLATLDPKSLGHDLVTILSEGPSDLVELARRIFGPREFRVYPDVIVARSFSGSKARLADRLGAQGLAIVERRAGRAQEPLSAVWALIDVEPVRLGHAPLRHASRRVDWVADVAEPRAVLVQALAEQLDALPAGHLLAFHTGVNRPAPALGRVARDVADAAGCQLFSWPEDLPHVDPRRWSWAILKPLGWSAGRASRTEFRLSVGTQEVGA
ncbi:hypothetical protein [Pararhodobacter zhoushanensis]|uniref:Uncharacterized protein n=1 Tax=Pararhodobacter zhoushanensis TaxID=2479545 RepID=A0ABT3GYK6_9RHOB|nr:hypothetical protein [Pararhodobacter zhoushanensis]MCW1932633.1 hypothetical protein [Pararhodobacter zhoushanensis]